MRLGVGGALLTVSIGSWRQLWSGAELAAVSAEAAPVHFNFIGA